MESADLFSSLLQDPDAMQKLAGIASELMQSSGAPAPPAQESPSLDESFTQLLPIISAISQSGQTLCHPARQQLLDALRPFLSSATCAHIDHAEHIVSMAQMAKTAQTLLLQQEV